LSPAATKWRSKRPAFDIEISKPIIFAATALLLLGGLLIWRINQRTSSSELVFEIKAKPPPSAPICPWREPEADLKQLFPTATRYIPETRILSGLRLELADRLGRAPTADENALRLYRIYRQEQPLGDVLTRRVKGAHGAIELVLGTDLEQRVRGLHLQRLREPEPVARALKDPAWLGAFTGKQADSAWRMGTDLPAIPPEARDSAQAIVEGARSLLILLAVSGHSNAPAPAAVAHH